ncbi:hypothetical protein PV327_001622 [Microctonus hyperodae]|uniref:Uncharacterized protein n=1 Tax=Microctonus hyperodae TaxID=165561 RepID=A0AA39FE23_MICHY|nr:hypothetical protein PV327_001622 [Microctonus hyperodae]
MTSEKEDILGVATISGYEPNFYPHESYNISTVAVTDYESYEHYTTITHELAHVFNAEHDISRDWFFVHPCKRSIMAATDCCSFHCLYWSDKTENEFEKFFNSPAHCILKNRPQSLSPSWQRPFRFTKLQQCQCYGYKSDNEINKKKSANNMCAENLECKDKENQVITNLPFPMNGTPCGDDDEDKVCWNEKLPLSRDLFTTSAAKKIVTRARRGLVPHVPQTLRQFIDNVGNMPHNFSAAYHAHFESTEGKIGVVSFVSNIIILVLFVFTVPTSRPPELPVAGNKYQEKRQMGMNKVIGQSQNDVYMKTGRTPPDFPRMGEIIDREVKIRGCQSLLNSGRLTMKEFLNTKFNITEGYDNHGRDEEFEENHGIDAIRLINVQDPAVLRAGKEIIALLFLGNH